MEELFGSLSISNTLIVLDVSEIDDSVGVLEVGAAHRGR